MDVEPVRGGCELVILLDDVNCVRFTAGGLFRTTTNHHNNGLITCAHLIEATQESDNVQVYDLQIYTDPEHKLGVVRKVWFRGSKGWDYCLVEDCSSVPENELMDFSTRSIVSVMGLTCSIFGFQPWNLIDFPVTRYGHQRPYKTNGYIFKYIFEQGEYAIVEIGKQERL